MPHFKREGFGSLQESETDTYTSATDLFARELVEAAVIQRRNCIVRPNAISNLGPLHVLIPPEGDYFIDPASIRVHADFTIKKLNAELNKWENLDAQDATKVAPVNGFTKCIFKDIETYIQQKQITLVATTAYPIKAYIETLCSYGTDAAKTHLRTSYWVPTSKNEADTEAIGQTNFLKRHKFIANSRTVCMEEPLHSELSTLNRYILPGLEISFIFTLSDAGYFLHVKADNETTYMLDFDDFYLSFDRILLNTHVYQSMERRLNAGTKAIYLLNRGTIRSKQVPANEHNALWQNMYVGTLPEMVTICMMKTTAFNGSISENFQNLQHFNIESIVLRVNSNSMPGQPLRVKMKENLAIRAYANLMENTGIKKSNNPIGITYEQFIDGSSLFAFDLTPDKCASWHSHKKENGNIEVDIRFSQALAEGITILALCHYSDRMYITGPYNNRDVQLNPNLS